MEKEGVVVFGGSAGSIEVIMNLFPLIPIDFPIPIVVILHRKNTSEHHLEDVLSRKSKIPVWEVQDKTQIKPGNIYIAPGDYHLLVDKDHSLVLDHSEKVNFSRPSIDVSFEEFARVYKSKCIGILLSGANSDGASGLKQIKEAGGLTIVQSPDSAKVATMPMSALNLFQPDVIADLQKIASLLLEAANYPVSHFVDRIKKGEEISTNLPLVLIVDDLEENLFALNAILKSEGYLIDKANSGSKALSLVREKSYDCILLDVQMPEMDGFDVAKKLGDSEETDSIPILFLSALGSDKEKVVEGLEVGAVDFIAKPPDPSILKAKIKNCINQSIKAKERSKRFSSIHSEFQSLKEYTSDVSASFRYAQNIQQAILPTEESLRSVCKDSFVIYKPKEAIGGDFYYVKNLGTKALFICGDCTGHGVPGAMMSMMSVNILNNIVDSRGITQPSKILQAVVREFNTAFRNEFNSNIIQDGLELSVCLHDKEKNKLYYSGAGARIFISFNQELKKLRGALIGINGSTSFDEEFPETEFDVSNGCKIYMFSDGMVDQFGGPNGKKFTTKRLEKSLQELLFEPMTAQKKELHQILTQWLGSEEQIDDILLLGFEL